MTDPYNNLASQKISQHQNIELPAMAQPKQNHNIGLIGCGAIGQVQLLAYQQKGWQVSVICNRSLDKAIKARDTYFPDAVVTTDYQDVLTNPEVDLVDITLHLENRVDIVKQAILAKKPVLSQKPFACSIEQGQMLDTLAKKHNVPLAVNQNGRWAPHFKALLDLVNAGYIGDISSADFNAFFPHDENLKGHLLADDPNLLLFDFSIHWFDIIAQLFKTNPAQQVYASVQHSQHQLISSPTLASVMIQFANAQASINMRASAKFEDQGSFHVTGSRGYIQYHGHSLGGDKITLVNEQGRCDIKIQPDWFPNALADAMADFLVAIEQNKTPSANPTSVLNGLNLCFSAMQSSQQNQPVAITKWH